MRRRLVGGMLLVVVLTCSLSFAQAGDRARYAKAPIRHKGALLADDPCLPRAQRICSKPLNPDPAGCVTRALAVLDRHVATYPVPCPQCVCPHTQALGRHVPVRARKTKRP